MTANANPSVDYGEHDGDDGGNERVDGRVNGREDRVEERLRAVERAITDEDRAVADLADEATAVAERDALSERVSELESRIEELEAATQAVRGYVGSVRAVNREVERRADLALAAATEARTAESDRDGRDGKPPDDPSGSIVDGSIVGGQPTTFADDKDPDNPSDDPAVAAAVPDGRSGASTKGFRGDEPDSTDGSEPSLGSGALSRLREVL